MHYKVLEDYTETILNEECRLYVQMVKKFYIKTAQKKY